MPIHLRYFLTILILIVMVVGTVAIFTIDWTWKDFGKYLFTILLIGSGVYGIYNIWDLKK